MNGKDFYVLTIVLTSVLAGAALTANATDWPTFHQNTALTGVSPDDGPDTDAFYWPPFQTGGSIAASPVIADGQVFIGNLNGEFYAVNAQTGQQNWMVNLGGSIHSTAAVDGGFVYVLDEDGQLNGLDVITGAPRPGWPKQLGDGDFDWSSPAVHSGNIFVADSTGVVRSRNLASGHPNWSKQLNGLVLPGQPDGVYGAYPNSMTTVANGKVYAGTHNMSNGAPTLVALNELNGNVVWSYDYYLAHGDITGMINCNGAAVADADDDPGLEVYFGVYIWSVEGVGPQAVCLDEATGIELWSKDIGGSSTSTPAVDDGKVFIGSDSGLLYCLDATNNGAELWTYQTGGDVWSSPVVADGKVYFGSLDHIIYCVDEFLGTLIWQYDTGASRLEGSGAVVDGVFYIGNENGKLYAFGIPEPSTLVLLGIGAITLLTHAWRRRLGGTP